MSDDNISRQAAVDLAEMVETARLKGEIDFTYPLMIKGLKQLPPTPEKTGTWILHDERYPWSTDYDCSECGKMFRIECKPGKTPEETFRFCPYCGQPKKAEEANNDTT